MKQIIIILIFVIALLLPGCNNGANPEHCLFHFPNAQIGFIHSDQVIGYEVKSFPVTGRDYKAILNEYLAGPDEGHLLNPFPIGATVTAVEISSKNVTITLNSKFATLKDADLSIAFACLVKTTLSIIPTQTVVLKAQNTFSDGSAYKAFSAASFLTEDNAKEIGMHEITED